VAVEDFRYISKDEFADVLEDLNIDEDEEGGFSKKRQRKLLARANGDLEADLVERFIVPLLGTGGAYETAPDYSRQKVLNALISKIRQIIGLDKQKNLVIDSTERFIDLKLADYNRHIKDLLNAKRTFGFKLQSFASDGAVEPVQSIGVARGDNKRDTFINDEEDTFI